MDVAELARDIAELRAANAELGAKVSKLEEEREQYRKLYQQMLEKAKKLERGLLGQKAERLPPSDAQLSLQLLAGLLGEREAAHRQRGRGRLRDELDQLEGLRLASPRPLRSLRLLVGGLALAPELPCPPAQRAL